MPKILFIILIPLLFSCNPKSDYHSVKHWTYKINYEFESTNDSIKPIGRVEFWRTKQIKDKLRKEVYNESWFPTMEFEIYNISDLEYCKEIGRRTKMFSSCIDTGVGGELIILKNFILINRAFCTNCYGTDDKIDFCEPIINEVLMKLDSSKNFIIKEIGKKINRAE